MHCENITKKLEKLSAYESTGLEPQEIEQLKIGFNKALMFVFPNNLNKVVLQFKITSDDIKKILCIN